MSEMELLLEYIRAYILFDFYGQGKEEKIMKCVNLSHVSLLCIQAGGFVARNIFPREIVRGGSLLPPLPSNSIISPTPDDDDAFHAFDQDYNEAGLRVYGSSSNY